jgi:phage terminase large subunit-like protein
LKQNQSLIDQLAAMPIVMREEVLSQLSEDQAEELQYQWSGWMARPAQELPKGDWAYWLILAGRGFGKTRTGAEAVREWVKTNQYVNLIGATADDARDIMVEGESGILAICSPDERPYYKKHESKLEWPNGATSLIFTADKPDRLRGKQHGKLWADELAAWRYMDAWDQAKFGLRLGSMPQAVITTTPRPLKLLKTIMEDPQTIVTQGSTYDNKANLAKSFFSSIITQYEGTRIGRQELNAELLDDMPGALWMRKNIDDHRKSANSLPDMERVVVAVDPSVTNKEGSDETGIIVGGRGTDGHAYVWNDSSKRMSPSEWGKIAVSLFHSESADVIVAESNNGGDMVEDTIRTVEPNVNVKQVRASRGKVTRAEPVAALYEQGRVHHVGSLDTLEDQMVSFTSDFDRSRQGYSPDRVDALVWMITELFPSMTKRIKEHKQSVIPKKAGYF